MSTPDPNLTPPRRPRIRLPFEKSRTDVGEWAYDHRVGLCITLIVYLVLAIAFVGAKIAIGTGPSRQEVIIDLRTAEQLRQERDRLEQEVRERQQEQERIDWGSIRNRTSNEQALNEALRDDRGTRTAELNESASEAQERMRANRDAYERGLAEARALGRRAGSEGEADERQDRRYEGTVTVSYSFTDPVRQGRYLENPAYLCQTGGRVVVAATLNRNGEVVDAKVVSGGDESMREAALGAARNSLFVINGAAPARQRGTITYVFIPQ